MNAAHDSNICGKRNYGIAGHFFWQIVDKETGRVESQSPVKKNLILNQGLDYIAARSFIENIIYCALGSAGTAPLQTDTGLASEKVRFNSLDQTVPGYASTSLNGNVYSLTLVFAAPVEKLGSYYGEIGWSYASSAGNNLYSKSQILDVNGNTGIIFVPINKYLRVSYTLSVTINPNQIQTTSANISDPTLSFVSSTGQHMIQLIGLKSINSNGTIGYYDVGSGCNEPSGPCSLFLSTNGTGLAPFGSSNLRTGAYYSGPAAFSYNDGSYQCIKSTSFGKSFNASGLNSFGLGSNGQPQNNSGFVHVFNSPQTKAAGYILQLQTLYSWNRM